MAEKWLKATLLLAAASAADSVRFRGVVTASQVKDWGEGRKNRHSELLFLNVVL